jgi:hypothetical protein
VSRSRTSRGTGLNSSRNDRYGAQRGTAWPSINEGAKDGSNNKRTDEMASHFCDNRDFPVIKKRDNLEKRKFGGILGLIFLFPWQILP